MGDIKFIRKNGKIIPIRGGAGAGGGGESKKGGKGSRIYRDGASKAGMREMAAKSRAESKSGGRKFQVAGLGLVGFGLTRLSTTPIKGLALGIAGAGLIGYGRRRMDQFGKGGSKKRPSTSVTTTKNPG